MSPRYVDLKIKLQELALLAATLLCMTACGSNVNQTQLTGFSQTGCTGLNCATTNPTATPSDPGNIYNLPSAPTYVAQINGVAGANPSAGYAIQTARTLKVKVTPLAAPNLTLPGYQGYVSPYGCLRMQVTVNNQVLTTDILRVGGLSSGTCANSPTYQVLDFTADVTGNGVTNVTVMNADYDNCRSFGSTLNYGCGMSAIFKNDIAAATIQIQGDGTYMSP